MISSEHGKPLTSFSIHGLICISQPTSENVHLWEILVERVSQCTEGELAVDVGSLLLKIDLPGPHPG